MILKPVLFFLLHVKINYDEIVNVENKELLFRLVLKISKVKREKRSKGIFYHMECLLYHVHQITRKHRLVLMDIYLKIS